MNLINYLDDFISLDPVESLRQNAKKVKKE
jgi:hypothetical protein